MALAFAAPQVFAAHVMQAAQSQSANVAPHCGDSAMMSAGSHGAHSPAMSMGHGDCCHASCHCLSTCGAALLVPFLATGVKPEQGSLHALIIAEVPVAMAAPPLRPPIA